MSTDTLLFIAKCETYLSRAFHTFPQTQVENRERHKRAQRQLPSDGAKVVNTGTMVKSKHASPGVG